MTSVVVQRTAEKKKKKTIFVVANLFIFIFIFRDVKRNYCFSLHVGWIGCRMDRLPAALVVWMPVLPDGGPANCDTAQSVYNKLGDRRHSRSTSPGPWATVSSCLSGNWIQAERVPRSLTIFFHEVEMTTPDESWPNGQLRLAFLILHSHTKSLRESWGEKA